MRRLNVVLVDLDKSQAEKNRLVNRIQDTGREIESLNLRLEEATHMKNVMNRNLEEDLKYEQDLNSKMESDVRKFEHER